MITRERATLELFEEDAQASRSAATAEAEARALADSKLRDLEADFTPRLVVRAILKWYFDEVLRIVLHRPTASGCRGCAVEGAEHSCPPPDYLLVQRQGVNRVLSRPTPVIRILDICAGAGVWASEIRKLFAELGVSVHITAVEIDREREAAFLPRHADEVFWGDWRAFAKQCAREGRRFDLVIGNPAFKRARALEVAGELDPTTSMPAMLTAIAGAVILYMSQQGWTKTAPGFEVRRRYRPAYAVDVPGAVSHRAGINPKTGARWSSDTVPYSATMWLGDLAGPHVGMMLSDMLEPFDGRSWREDLRPGAEPDAWLRSQGIPYFGVRCTKYADHDCTAAHGWPVARWCAYCRSALRRGLILRGPDHEDLLAQLAAFDEVLLKQAEEQL